MIEGYPAGTLCVITHLAPSAVFLHWGEVVRCNAGTVLLPENPHHPEAWGMVCQWIEHEHADLYPIEWMRPLQDPDGVTFGLTEFTHRD